MEFLRTEQTEYDGKFYRILCAFEENGVLSGQYFKFKEEPTDTIINEAVNNFIASSNTTTPIETKASLVPEDVRTYIKEAYFQELQTKGEIIKPK